CGNIPYFFSVLAFVCLLQFTSQTEHLNNGEDICRLFPDDTVLRKPGYCDRTIVCKNSVSTEGTLCTNDQVYSLTKNQCQKSLDSFDTYCKHPCTSKTSGYVGDTFNCENWYYCDKSDMLLSGVCGNNMYFDQSQQMCTYPSNATCNAVYELCQVVPSGVKVKDEHNCNMYITCASGKATSNLCEAGNYYDSKTGSCVKKSLVSCSKHPHPDEVCGTKKLAIRNKFVSDGATCRGYFYCRDFGSGQPDESPTWHQCSENYFFNEELQVCQERSACRCSEDRCDGRVNGYELVETDGCQHYIECENNAEKGDVLKCDDNMYFDVQAQKCTTTKVTYGACHS
ncbi:hypothetical protein KR222_006794, partial [Zaprionus bogoriensis]